MGERHIQKIVRKLKCSRKKRQDIKRQLTAEFMGQIESGVSEQEILNRMGTPSEIAAEFNSNFSMEEQKKYKREKWMKRLAIIGILLIVMVAGIIWAIPKTFYLEDSKRFSQEAVVDRTKEVIRLLDEEDFDTLKDMSADIVQEYLEPETFQKNKEFFAEDWGEFVEFRNTYCFEVVQMGKHRAMVQMAVGYENVMVTYTLFFNEEMQVEGIWMR